MTLALSEGVGRMGQKQGKLGRQSFSRGVTSMDSFLSFPYFFFLSILDLFDEF